MWVISSTTEPTREENPMSLLKKFAVLGGAAVLVRNYAQKNPAQVRKYAGQAGEFVGKQTNHKYDKQIDVALRKVEDATRTKP